MPDPTVPVSVHGFTWTAAFVGLLNLLVGGALVALIKQWPRLKELAQAERKDKVAERNDEMKKLRDRVDELEKKVEAASQATHAAEMRLVYAVAAIQLLAAKVRADSPDDPSLKQANELLAAATSGELPSWAKRLDEGLAQRAATDPAARSK